MAKTIYRREYQALLEWLLAAREASGLTQGQVAAALGHAQSTLSHIERGSRRLDIVELLDYCRVIGADPRELLEALLRESARRPNTKRSAR